jgi:putative mRNA 3-end processing factor
VPAGHVLGSAQVVMRWKGLTIVVSGDYKRRRDPTCPLFEPVPCDVFVSEATFGLPVFRHPDDGGEIAKLLKSVAQFPERTHLVGAYALGKAQRLICLLREAGYEVECFV